MSSSNCCLGCLPFLTPAVQNKGLEHNLGLQCGRVIVISSIAASIFFASLYAAVTTSYSYILLTVLTPVVCLITIIADWSMSGKVVSKNRNNMTELSVKDYTENEFPSKQTIEWIRDDQHTLKTLIDTYKDDEKELIKQLNKLDSKDRRCLFHYKSSNEVLMLLLTTLQEKIDFTTKDSSELSFFEEAIKYNKEECVKTIIENQWVTHSYVEKIDLSTLKPNDSIRFTLTGFLGTESTNSAEDIKRKFNNVTNVMGNGKDLFKNLR